MKFLNPLWESAKNYIYNNLRHEPGKAMTIATVIGFASASIAQSIAIAGNKKVSDKEKKFLIPQELVDGAVNVASCVLIMGIMTKCATKLAETGRWTTHDIEKLIEKLPEAAKSAIGKPKTDLGKIFFDNANPEDKKEFYPIFYNFKWGMEMLTSTIGSILAYSVLAPFVRNNVAAEFQKRATSPKPQVSNAAHVSTPNNQNNYYTRMYIVSNRSLLKI